MLITETDEATTTAGSLPQVKMRLLEQMAEALEDEATVLYRRAATFEEDEFLLNREIEERQTEINRLQLKLDVIRAERDRVTERIESITEEVSAMREQTMLNEGNSGSPLPERKDRRREESVYFRRASMADQPGVV